MYSTSAPGTDARRSQAPDSETSAPRSGESAGHPVSYREALAAARAGRLDEAIAALRRILAATPDHIDARVLLGDRTSPIAELASLDLSDVLCRADDRVVGITMRYDGLVAFATELGVAGVVPRQAELMTKANLRTVSLNGPDCASDKPREDLEQVSNSIAADENGGVYMVTSKAQYKFSSRKGVFAQQWRAEYRLAVRAPPRYLARGRLRRQPLHGETAWRGGSLWP